ncbi:MAG: helix-turn-helix transcriptional regulator [Caldilineaceae bacterium]
MRNRRMRSADAPNRWHQREGANEYKLVGDEHANHEEQRGFDRGERRQDRQSHGRQEYGRGRDRIRRGDARYIVLDALRDGPKHGYEIIKALEERSAGRYVPSPGTVYPTLQYLEDQGLVRSSQEAERRIYQLTEAGQAELDTLAEQVNAFWKRFGGQDAATPNQHEVNFLQDELEHLNRIVWGGLQSAIAQGRQETIRSVRNAVEECQNKVREIIATEQTQ